MALTSIVNFSDIGKRRLLRCGARYVDFWKNQDGRIFDSNIKTFSLKRCVEFASSTVIKQNQIEKTYQLIDLQNIEPETGHPLNLEENIVAEIGSDKVYLDDADLIFSKLNSHIGYVFLRSEIPSNEYEVIGSTEFFPLKVDKKIIYIKLLKYFLLHKSFRNKAVFLRSGKSQSHPRIQPDDFFNLKIPQIDEVVQKRIVKEIGKTEKAVSTRRKKLESLQKIIDDVLTKYALKSRTKKTYRAETLVPCLEDVAQNKAIRLGAQYNAFWLNHDGYLFEGTDKKWKIVPLKRIMKMSPKVVLKKGILAEPRVLIDFEQINALYGTIEIENIVPEIGSDKVEFGNCDLVTNKLDPYSGYTFLNNPELKMIGTSELWPINIIDKKKADKEFIRHLLLSTEYLEKSKLLMSGKRHPRIYHLDFLNIRIPLPDIKIQRKIVKEIKNRELKSQNARERIKKLREQIDRLILEALSKNENCTV